MYKRKLLGERRLTARVEHECDIEEPDCVDPMISPGDKYIRETWLHFGIREDGSKFRYIFITKRHDSPCCKPDPKLFEEGEVKIVDSFKMQMAA
jgi:hypothetical protein